MVIFTVISEDHYTGKVKTHQISHIFVELGSRSLLGNTEHKSIHFSFLQLHFDNLKYKTNAKAPASKAKIPVITYQLECNFSAHNDKNNPKINIPI